ncbi:putative Methyltransf_21 domain-containing protein [Tenacibaculum sp. 190524A05c]|uniref:FkbM family methyltransferase n=1 Tax=Tenacibaculum platacis TaxID=3137852 RepID=UPI0031FACDEA
MKNTIKKILKKSFLYPLLSKIKNGKRLKLEANYNRILSNVVGGNIVVDVKNIPGNYEFDFRSDILRRILISKVYEPEIVDAILKNLPENADAINIGANVGLYTNLLAQNMKNNKVLAIEPTKSAYNLLTRNIERNNNKENVITFKGIISDVKGNFTINTVVGKEEYSSIGNLVHTSINEEPYETEEISGITLDELTQEHKLNPKLLVIDVEGAEYKVLKGAKKTLEKSQPIIISELDDKLLVAQETDSKEIISFLEALNYEVKDVDGGKIQYPFTGNIIAKSKSNS